MGSRVSNLAGYAGTKGTVLFSIPGPSALPSSEARTVGLAERGYGVLKRRWVMPDPAQVEAVDLCDNRSVVI
jgi:hypothetical protein